MLHYVPIVFILEFVVSFLLNSGSIAILTRKPNRAVLLSVATNICTWASFYIIGKISDWSIPLILASICGDVLGDYIVAKRKPKKKVYKKKFPVSTA